MIVYVSGVSVLVLTAVGPKAPFPAPNGPIVTEELPIVTVPVPVGTLPPPALSLPDTLMLAVPWVIVREVGPGTRILNAGWRFSTFVKFAVEFRGKFVRPLPFAVTVAVIITVVPGAAVSL